MFKLLRYAKKYILPTIISPIFMVGEVILELMRKGYKMHRDGLHVTLGLGRYALSLLWYSYLSGKSIDDVTIADFDEPISDEEIADAKATVNKVLGR